MAIVRNHLQDPRSIPSARSPIPDAKGRGCRRALASFVILLAGIVFALGVAAASAGPRISLDVHNTPSNGSDGYTDTTASNGAIYSYRYSGGEGKGGDVIFKTRGRVTVNVHVANGSGYSIDDVSFIGDAGEQLSWLNPNAGKVAVIQNLNTVVQVANYKVTVRDEAADVTVPCDPRIVNQ
jgi:hypothetical protein